MERNEIDEVDPQAVLVPGSDRWAAAQADAIRLLKGETSKRGKASFTRVYRSTAGFDALNNAVRAVAAVARPGVEWTDEDTWGAVESVVTPVADDDLSRRGLLAAKIFLGYRATPDEQDPVPMCDEAIAYAKEERRGQLYTLALIRASEPSVPSDAAFEDSITVREGFAAPMFSPTSATPSTFRADRTRTSLAIREVADELLTEVFAYVDAHQVGSHRDAAETPEPPAKQSIGHALMEWVWQYFRGWPHENQYSTGQLSGEALDDRLEEKRLRVEYRGRNITREEYRTGRAVIKARRRERELSG